MATERTVYARLKNKYGIISSFLTPHSSVLNLPSAALMKVAGATNEKRRPVLAAEQSFDKFVAGKRA